MTTPDTEDAAAQYDGAVELERAAWQALQACERGSAARAEAWARWTQAISNTNQAWRRLSSHAHPVQPGPAGNAC